MHKINAICDVLRDLCNNINLFIKLDRDMALLRQDVSEQGETRKNKNTRATGDPLAIIYNEGMWRLNKVSPMYKMLYRPVKLKMYASKVKQAIVSAVQASSAKYSVKFEELPNLRYCPEEASGLMVTVSSTLESSISKEVYVAVLLSWGQNEKLDETIHLPYMLERGEQKVATAVRSTMQTLFDCSIKQFSFTQQQLLQFGFNFVDCDMLKNTDPFTITYSTPQVDHKEKLSLSFNVEDINVIWQGVKDDDMITHSELVNYTYRILQNQIFHMLLLDITVFHVSEIRTPKAEIKSNGVVKMKTPEMVNCVFTILNEISNMYMKL